MRDGDDRDDARSRGAVDGADGGPTGEEAGRQGATGAEPAPDRPAPGAGPERGPLTPESVRVEHAAFVVLGVALAAALVASLL